MLSVDTSNEGRLALLQALKKLVKSDNATRLLFIKSLRLVLWSLRTLSAANLRILNEFFQHVDIRDFNFM